MENKEVVNKFGFSLKPEDAQTFHEIAIILGWQPGRIARVLVEEFIKGKIKLPKPSDPEKSKDFFK